MALGKPRRGLTADPQTRADRARGALLGLAIGDALGTATEWKRPNAPAFPQLCDGVVREPQGGAYGARPGQVTDDTVLATCIAWSLRERHGYDAQDVWRRYVAVRALAPGLGEQTSAVLEALLQKGHLGTAAHDWWVRQGKRPAGNAALSRTAPIGVYLAADDTERARASLEDAGITHADPRCQLACAALNGAIARAIQSPRPPTGADLVEGAKTAISVAGPQLGKMAQEHVREVLDAAALLRADLDAARGPDPQLYGPELHLNAQQGFVRVALRLAFWEALHAPTAEAALIDVANRGGDACGNGAVTGALVGALHGEAALPERWRRAVLDAGSGTGPLWDVYHPRHLLALVDA